MGVRQDHGLDGARVDRQRRPVAQAQGLVTLKKPAIDKKPMTFLSEKVFGTGHRAGGAQEG